MEPIGVLETSVINKPTLRSKPQDEGILNNTGRQDDKRSQESKVNEK